MLKILYGNEPYLIDYFKKKFTEGLAFPEMNLLTLREWSREVPDFLSTYPVMDEFRVVVLYLDSFKEFEKAVSGNEKFLSSVIASPTQRFVVITGDVDKRTSFYKKLSKDANKVLLSCEKMDEVRLKKAIMTEVARLGATMDDDTYALFADKENYAERDDINLLNVYGDIARLASYDKHITKETVELLVKANIQENVFGICKMIQSGNLRALKGQAEVLEGSEIGVLSALLREYRLAFKGNFFSAKEIGVKYIALSGLSMQEITEGMSFILSVIDGMKDGSIPPSDALRYVFLKLVKPKAA